MNSSIITGLQTVTAAGPVTPTSGLDISGVSSGDCTIHIRVRGFGAASGGGVPKASIQLEDSVNGFTASLPHWLGQQTGPVDPGGTGAEFIIRKYQLPNMRFGVAGAAVRVNVPEMIGTSPSLTLESWLEQ